MQGITVIVLSIIFNVIVVCGKSLPSGQKNQTCPKKQLMKYLCDNVKQDMSYMVNKKANVGQSKPATKKNMFSTFSTVKKLGQDKEVRVLELAKLPEKYKIVERLYFFHNILGDGYRFFGKTKANQRMKIKTINIVIQIKSLAEILQNNTNCNPGKPGNEFKFDLPNDKPSSGTNSGFLYHFAALLKEMIPEFEKNVVQQLKLI